MVNRFIFAVVSGELLAILNALFGFQKGKAEKTPFLAAYMLQKHAEFEGTVPFVEQKRKLLALSPAGWHSCCADSQLRKVINTFQNGPRRLLVVGGNPE